MATGLPCGQQAGLSVVLAPPLAARARCLVFRDSGEAEATWLTPPEPGGPAVVSAARAAL